MCLRQVQYHVYHQCKLVDPPPESNHEARRNERAPGAAEGRNSGKEPVRGLPGAYPRTPLIPLFGSRRNTNGAAPDRRDDDEDVEMGEGVPRVPVNEASKTFVTELQSSGVEIATPSYDITDKEVLEKTIASALSSMPPVRGGIHASAVLSDNVFTVMTADEWHKASNVKVAGSKNLWDVLTSHSARSTLEFFIMLSSLVSVTGNNGQTNYSAGNSFQGAMAASLASQGHNVVALDLPVMIDTGIVAVRPMLKEYLLSTGWPCMTNEELIRGLDYYCRPTDQGTGVSAVRSHVIPRLWLPRYTADESAEQPAWQHESKYNHLVLHGYEGGNAQFGKQGSGKRSVGELIAAAKSLEEAEQVVLSNLLEQLAKVLGYEVADLDATKSMGS
ncbi:reducing type I polyketide synthase [Apiospora rasikravindrae]|uniref:Reducing type I polyketide synthase n=1 Tax=Apiospora rasikravindrae TaxID=990691 RepID=A0ABR1S2I2_9PEZI